MDGPLLDRDDLRALLVALGEELHGRGVEARLFVVGGAAMALVHLRDRVTRDVDAIFEPTSLVREAAAVVATERGLAADWLNDAVKGFLLGADPDASTYLEVPGLRVEVASPRYLFTLKALAARVDRDAADLVALYRLCGFADVDEALAHVQRHAPPPLLHPKVAFLLRELLADA